MMLQTAFQNRANSAAIGVIDRLEEPRRLLGNKMFECSEESNVPTNGQLFHLRAWDGFFQLYYHTREIFVPSSDYHAMRIKEWFLSGTRGFRFQCPGYLENIANPVMMILNCMSRRDIVERVFFDRFEGKSYVVPDSGNLVHLAINLNAPAEVIRVLVQDSCGLALNVRGRRRGHCRVPPFGLIDQKKAHKMNLNGLNNLLHLGVKYMWCLPFFYRFSVWRIVKYVSTYPNPVFRSTSHILMDFGFDYNPVIRHAIEHDRTVMERTRNDYLATALSPFTVDQAGTGCSLLFRIVQLVEQQNLGIDPIYSLIRGDPVGFISSFGKNRTQNASAIAIGYHHALPAFSRDRIHLLDDEDDSSNAHSDRCDGAIHHQMLDANEDSSIGSGEESEGWSQEGLSGDEGRRQRRRIVRDDQELNLPEILVLRRPEPQRRNNQNESSSSENSVVLVE